MIFIKTKTKYDWVFLYQEFVESDLSKTAFIKRKRLPTTAYAKLDVGEKMMDENIIEQLIGCWQNDGGWGFIIGEMVELIPLVSKTLTNMGANEMLVAFENVINCFPEGTVFENTVKYYDLYNFMQSYSYKVQDETLKAVPVEQRRVLVTRFRNAIDELDEITEKYWNI